MSVTMTHNRVLDRLTVFSSEGPTWYGCFMTSNLAFEVVENGRRYRVRALAASEVLGWRE